ncbi:hypothetical protein GGS24DRAFT_452188 [Hypoxylon argillaceum]|nr:hypothetical protein GGS24DRAFT_452188 [Hypoxylon argillaceum]KAI1151930.1 hypothetical protein F4825DRAFT_421227 [Nemania diffusa]
MYNAKVLLPLAVLAGLSLAQTTTDAAACTSKINALLAAAPVPPAALETYLFSQPSGGVDGLLTHPDLYVTALCSAASSLPSSLVAEFAVYGGSLLNFASVEISSYDAIVTGCITTGAAASSITSYIHSIASSPEALCQPTSTPAAGNGTVSSVTPYPTATASASSNGTVPTTTAASSTVVPTAGAAKVGGVFAGAAALGGLLGAVALL